MPLLLTYPSRTRFRLLLFPSIILLLCILLTCPVTVSSQSVFPTPAPTPANVKGIQPGTPKSQRMWGIASNAPLLRTLRRNPDAKKATVELGSWFARAAKEVDRKRKESRGADCNLKHDWTGKAIDSLKDVFVGKPESACATAIFEEAENATKLFTALQNAAGAFQNAGTAVVSVRNLKSNWTKTHALRDWDYEVQTQSCVLQRSAAVRRRGEWYLLGSFTNDRVNKRLPDWERRIVEEYVHVELRNALPIWINDTAKNKAGPPQLSMYSTRLASWDGTADISAYYDMKFHENDALSKTMEHNELWIEQARDAIRPSNVAILALPLFMAFVPIALIADVNDCAAFVYIMFTDFFSALPFVVKGFELVGISNGKSYHAETWLVGNSTLQVAEAWAAECSPTKVYRNPGIVFIVVGIATICLGFGLEHFARKYFRRRTQIGADPHPLGHLLISQYSPLYTIPRNYSGDQLVPEPNFEADNIPGANAFAMRSSNVSDIPQPPNPVIVPEGPALQMEVQQEGTQQQQRGRSGIVSIYSRIVRRRLHPSSSATVPVVPSEYGQM